MVGLAHVGLLWTGLALVSVPILIHFFFRRRHRVVRWPAMDFLLAALRKQRRRMQVENLILLLLRCALIALLALAVARPAVQASALAPFSSRATGVVLVVDTSASMATLTTGRTSLDRARERARTFLQGLPQGSVVTVVATRDDRSGGAPNTIIETASPDRARDRLDKRLRQSHGSNQLGEVFRFVRTKLNDLEGRRLAVFITDLQRRDWHASVGGGRLQDVHRALLDLRPEGDAPAPPVVLIDAGGADTANVAVADFRLEEDREAITGTTAGLTARIVNYGPNQTSGMVTLRVARDDGSWETGASKKVTLGPCPDVGAPRQFNLNFFHQLTRAAEGPARFRLVFKPADGSDDRLLLDNTFFLALRVRPPVRFLPLHGPQRALEVLEDTDVLEVMSLAAPVTAARLSTMDLSRTDAVLWADADVSDLDERGLENLEDFVKRGGGLLVYLGSEMAPGAVNERFFKERGQGLFPMQLTDEKPFAIAEDQTPFEIDFKRADVQQHSLFKETGEFAWSPAILMFRRVTMEKAGRVVARYNTDDGDPAVIEHRLGRGRILIVTTTPDERWFRLDGSLLPSLFFFNAAHYLVQEESRFTNVTVGRTLQFPLGPGARRVIVEPPDEAGGRIEEQVEDPSRPFALKATQFPGFYRVTIKGLQTAGAAEIDTDEVRIAAVNHDPAEGDLRRTGVSELRKIYPNTTLQPATSTDALPRAVGDQSGELSRALLVAVIAILFLELLLAWRFGSRRRAAA